MGLSCLTLIIGRFSRDYRELRFKNTIIPVPCDIIFPWPASLNPLSTTPWPATLSAPKLCLRLQIRAPTEDDYCLFVPPTHDCCLFVPRWALKHRFKPRTERIPAFASWTTQGTGIWTRQTSRPPLSTTTCSRRRLPTARNGPALRRHPTASWPTRPPRRAAARGGGGWTPCCCWSRGWGCCRARL